MVALEAAAYLIRLWRRGQALTVEELAQELGYGGLEVAPLLEELA